MHEPRLATAPSSGGSGANSRATPSGTAVSASYSYGLPAGPTTATGAATGTVCVRESLGSSQCQKVCCLGNVEGECEPGVTCVSGRCGGVKIP